MLEYARLELARDITTANGAHAHTVVVMRPNARQFNDMTFGDSVLERFDKFVSQCCRALNGTGELLEIRAHQLDAGDGGEVAEVIQEMYADGDKVPPEADAGDGFDAPLIYTLKRPLQLTAGEDGDRLTHIEFRARRLGEISEFLDAQNTPDEFPTFMRTFGQPVGTKLPMTDNIANAIDFIDYLAIRKHVMGKLVKARGRWKKT